MRDNHPKLKLVGSNGGNNGNNLRPSAAQSKTGRPSTPAVPERMPALLRAGETNAARQIAMENRAAGSNPTMSPTDPRWVLAVRAQSQLEGAALSPERREKLMQLANHLGIRSFDANLIVALVQDRARRGAPLDDLTGTLTMLPISTRDENHYFWRWLMAGICGAFIAVMLIRWVLGVG